VQLNNSSLLIPQEKPGQDASLIQSLEETTGNRGNIQATFWGDQAGIRLRVGRLPRFLK
jgi:hypothetical protein